MKKWMVYFLFVATLFSNSALGSSGRITFSHSETYKGKTYLVFNMPAQCAQTALGPAYFAPEFVISFRRELGEKSPMVFFPQRTGRQVILGGCSLQVDGSGYSQSFKKPMRVTIPAHGLATKPQVIDEALSVFNLDL